MTTTQSGIFGALWIDGVEVLDGGIRWAWYQTNKVCGGDDCTGEYVNMAEFKNPLDLNGAPVPIGTYPGDEANGAAPWFVPNSVDVAASTASSGFLGFFVDDVTGVREVPFSRQQYTRGGYPGGGVVAGARNIAREITFTVTAKACDGPGLSYGTRWLGEQLLGANRLCGSSQIAIREGDPNNLNPDRGLWTLYEAGITTPPIWTTDPDDCTIAQGTFTITVGDPCLYGPYTAVTTGTISQQTTCTGAWDPCSMFMGPVPANQPQRKCGTIPATPSLGANGAVIELTNNGATESGGFLITTVPNPGAGACAGAYGTPPTSTIAIGSFPPGTTVQIDVLRRSILSKPGPISPWESARGLLDLSTGVSPSWQVSRDTAQAVFVEPVRPWCVPAGGVGVSIGWRHKEGCVD